MQQRVQFANQLRGVAAFSVLISHLFETFWLHPKVAEDLTLCAPLDISSVPWIIEKLGNMPYFYLGPIGVSLFFLISGFVIPYSLNSSSNSEFAIRRFLRIVPLYMIAFLITITAIYCCAHAHSIPFPYKIKKLLIHAVPGLRDLFHIPNIDGIIWTLEIEIKFYLLCILFRRWLFDARILFLPIILLLTQLTLASFFSTNKIYELFIECRYLSYILIGTSFYLVRLGKISLEVWTISLIFIFGLLIRTASFIPDHPKTIFWTSCLWSQGWALLLFFGAATFPWLVNWRILDFLAKISYPLYLIHAVPGFVIMVYLHRFEIHPLLISMIASAVVILAAWGLHILFEKPLLAFAKNRTLKIKEHGTV